MIESRKRRIFFKLGLYDAIEHRTGGGSCDISHSVSALAVPPGN